MRSCLILVVSIATCATFARPAATNPLQARAAGPRVLMDNARVRVYRTTADQLAGVSHGPAVVVSIADGAGAAMGKAVWVDDAAVATSNLHGDVVIVQPLRPADA